MNRGRVTARVNGGLGNQLFQYATARRLALHNGVPLTIDHLTGFPRDFYKRRYMLEHFDVHGELIERRASYVSNWGRLKRKIEVRLNRSRPLADRTYLLEPDGFAFQPELLELKVTRPIYMEGYWQHEAYFADIRELLCREITQRAPHDATNLEFAKRIHAQPTPVCLHVRRMHGVANTKDAKPLATVSDWHHVDPSYFQRAVDVMSERVSNPYFFVFADYPDWAREHVRPAHPHEYVTHNGADRDYEDFWLMRQCRHFIIANSTFSWWAAWLAAQQGKVVVAPKEAVGKMIQSVPPTWIQV